MDAKELSEEVDLLRRFHQGDHTAFEVLFRTFHPAISFFARRITTVLPKGQAEEIVQDTFLKLWDRRTKFPDLQAVKAFLYITVRNACLNDFEKEQVQQRKQERYLYTVNEIEDAVIEEIIYSEVLREVSQTIETLPEQCRRIMKMAYEDGLAPKEIAEALNITVSTVNNQKARGISLLKKRLSDKGFAVLLFFL